MTCLYNRFDGFFYLKPNKIFMVTSICWMAKYEIDCMTKIPLIFRLIYFDLYSNNTFCENLK